MNMLKRSLALMLTVCMLLSVVPFGVLAEEAVTEPVVDTTEAVETVGDQMAAEETETEAAEEPATEAETEAATEAETETATEAETEPTVVETEPVVEETEPAEVGGEAEVLNVDAASFIRVFHLDCGRKYFTVDQVKELIDAISAAGFTHMELAIGNDGLRLLLDDMSVTANGTTYDSATVKSGIQSGNKGYSHSGEWTQAEMDTIIAYADSKNIEIIPLVNNPGHMDSILAAMKACGIDGYYESSKRTVDLENAKAVAFTQALVMKYAQYFASKGCKYFNIGADEYANDYHTSDSTGMGFGHLVTNKKYGNFVTYVNTLVEDICALGMTPIAFNDGIYYNSTTTQGTFDSRLVVAAWSGGWGGIKPAKTTFLVQKGHQILNTNERWYYVPSASSGYTYNNALSNAKSVSATTVTDNTGAVPMGAMQCVWFDYPNVNYETYKNDILTLIKTLSENNKDLFVVTEKPVEPEEPEVPEVPEEKDPVTKTDEATGVAITVPGLTELTVAVAEAPVIETAAEGKVLAWDMTPATAAGSYVGEAVVAVPVPEGWNADRMRGFVVEADGTVTLIDGDVNAEGNFQFTMPHFSVGGVMELAEEALEDKIINGTTTTTVVSWEPATSIKAGEAYIIVNNNTNGTRYALTNNNNTTAGSTPVTISGGKITQVNGAAISDNNVTNILWTFSGTNSGTVKNGNRYVYLNYSSNNNASLQLSTNNRTLTFTNRGNGQYRIYYDGSTDPYLRYNNGWTATTTANNGNVYLFGKTETPTTVSSYTVEAKLQESRIGEYTVENDNYTDESWNAYQDALTAAKKKLAEVEGDSYDTEPEAQAAIDELRTVVGDLEDAMKALAKARTITVVYQVNGETVGTATLKVPENARTYELPGTVEFNGVAYLVGNTTLTLGNATTYTVAVTVRPFDPDAVDKLPIEYWITNHPVTPDGQNVITSNVDHEGNTKDNPQRIYIEISAGAEGIYSENGVALTSLVADTGVDSHMTDNEVVFWKGVALNTRTNQQTTLENDNESYSGTDFTRVRYWNDAWQYFTGTEWVTVTGNTQLVAYYLQKTTVTNLDVIQTEVVDWGEIYGETSFGDADFVAMDFAIKYEDGTRNPNSFAVRGKTLLFHCADSAKGTTVFEDGSYKYRRIGTIHATETSNYEVYMITITPNSDNKGTSSGVADRASGVGTINYNGTEKVVWVDDVANLGKFEDEDLQHADFTVGGEPTLQKVDIYNRHAVLITYYIKAKVTPDSLTVHYMDRSAGDVQFYDYNIAVEKGTYFDERIALPNPWKGNLVNGTVQTIDKNVKQTVSSDLSTLPAVAAQYLNSQYECVEIELVYTEIENEDGTTSRVPKDLYLYYTFNPTVVFVADFGLPLVINATDLNESLDGIVESMEVTGGSYTAYGQVVANGTSKSSLIYRPTKVMQGTDFFTILVTTTSASGILDQSSRQVAFRVYVAPATTVYYEESFITLGNGWSRMGSATNTSQSTVLMGEAGTNNYGYDAVYSDDIGSSNGTYATTSTRGAEASFTFTGTGFELYANCADTTSWVTVIGEGNTVNKMYLVNTELNSGEPGSEENDHSGTFYNIPVVSEKSLPYGSYTVTIRKTNDERPIQVDGFRVINTIAPASHGIYNSDLESNPSFYQLRDAVLYALGAANVDYKQVYDSVKGAEAIIIDKNVDYANSNTVQDLLDNGPKNEVYLYPNQTLTFKVNTNRCMQLGLKAPNGATSYAVTVNGTAKYNTTMNTSVDMFYTLVGTPAGTPTEYLVTVTNSGNNILSVTDLKICNDPNATFGTLSEEDVAFVLNGDLTPVISQVTRISGKNRFATSFAIADALKAELGQEKFDTMIVACASNFPDALSGSYLAAVNNAPILLVDDSAIAEVSDYVEKNLTDNGLVYILGGTGAVSEKVENAIKAVAEVKRLSGKDRVATNLAILNEAGVASGQEILVCTSANFADSLSAAATGLPMLLVGDKLTAEQKQFLSDKGGKITIIGGEGAVSADIAAELGVAAEDRISGKSRFETSVKLAQRYFSDPDTVVLAYSHDFPDGLCGGALAVAMNAPVILTNSDSYTAADDYVQNVAKGLILGGAARIDDNAARAIFELEADAVIGTR